MNYRELARQLGRAPSTVYGWCDEFGIPVNLAHKLTSHERGLLSDVAKKRPRRPHAGVIRKDNPFGDVTHPMQEHALVFPVTQPRKRKGAAQVITPEKKELTMLSKEDIKESAYTETVAHSCSNDFKVHASNSWVNVTNTKNGTSFEIEFRKEHAETAEMAIWMLKDIAAVCLHLAGELESEGE